MALAARADSADSFTAIVRNAALVRADTRLLHWQSEVRRQDAGHQSCFSRKGKQERLGPSDSPFEQTSRPTARLVKYPYVRDPSRLTMGLERAMHQFDGRALLVQETRGR